MSGKSIRQTWEEANTNRVAVNKQMGEMQKAVIAELKKQVQQEGITFSDWELMPSSDPFMRGAAFTIDLPSAHDGLSAIGGLTTHYAQKVSHSVKLVVFYVNEGTYKFTLNGIDSAGIYNSPAALYDAVYDALRQEVAALARSPYQR